jgi:hypothetical protein
VRDRQLALERFRKHDPESEFLYPPPKGAIEPPTPERVQLEMFGDREGEA